MFFKTLNFHEIPPRVNKNKENFYGAAYKPVQTHYGKGPNPFFSIVVVLL